MGNGVCQKCRTQKNNANFYANGGRIFIICADCEREGTMGSQDGKPKTELIYVGGQFRSVDSKTLELMKNPGAPQVSGSNAKEKPFPILPTNY